MVLNKPSGSCGMILSVTASLPTSFLIISTYSRREIGSLKNTEGRISSNDPSSQLKIQPHFNDRLILTNVIYQTASKLFSDVMCAPIF
jgi:hypothetical protein